MSDIMRGGWLANRKKWVALIILILPLVAGYLTGDISLPDLVQGILQALLGV